MAKKAAKKAAEDDEPKEPLSSRAGLGCLLLFGLPFATIGVVMTAATLLTVGRWREVQHWVETPATLLESRLDVDSDDDGTSYSIDAKYAYDFNNQHFES